MLSSENHEARITMNIIAEEKKYIFQTYRRYGLVLTRGKGKYVWDSAGKRYLDFFAGLSVCNVGHCHPRVVAAIRQQAGKLLHVSNLYYTEPQVRLAKLLVQRSFPGKVFFANSGAEANECAIKIARKWGNRDGSARSEIITFEQSFHGRTMATITATGQPKFQKGLDPLLPGFRYARFNDLASVKALISDSTAAIMVEPVQGEGGVNPATREFLEGLRKLCDRHKLLLIFDEVQAGLGRAGKLFAFQNYGVTPDVLTLAKSLGGGLPIGAVIATETAASLLGFGEHASTFGGNPVVCAAAIEVMGILTPALLKRSVSTGNYFVARLNALKAKYPFIKDVRGTGLMVGCELDLPGRDIVRFCQEKGLLINCTQDTILRFLPPLIIDRKDVDTAIKILEEAFTCTTSKR
jgi:predicted acetylornithine/succinylornithine family transaminase